jgi:hypothetical protein
MQWSLAIRAIWLALGNGAAALAPGAMLELSPEAAVSPQPVSRRQHSHSVLKDLIAPSAAAQLTRGDVLEAQFSHSVLKDPIAPSTAAQLTRGDVLETQLDPQSSAAPVPPPEVPTQPSQSQPLQLGAGEEQLRGWGDDEAGDDFCAGKAIYDGPAEGWEDCRAMCRSPCKFWSYGQDSVQHRCKLTIECVDVSVGAYSGRADDAMGEGDDQAALGKGQASPTPEPQEAAPPEANEKEVLPAQDSLRQTCSPQGSARKFAVSPEAGGWQNIGVAHHYADCASAVASMGYKSLVWNIGSRSRGRCYGFASDVPEIFERSCEDANCWLFGPACGESAGH